MDEAWTKLEGGKNCDACKELSHEQEKGFFLSEVRSEEEVWV